MFGLPLILIPAVRIEVFPEVSATVVLPSVVTDSAPDTALTLGPVFVAGADTSNLVPSRMFVTTGIEVMAAPPGVEVAVAGADN
jgi:hypothetical protein